MIRPLVRILIISKIILQVSLFCLAIGQDPKELPIGKKHDLYIYFKIQFILKVQLRENTRVDRMITHN